MTSGHAENDGGYQDEGTSRGNAGRVLAYLVDKRGVMASAEDAARALGMTAAQFMASVSYLIREKGARVDRPARGFVVFHRMPEEDVTALRRQARGERVSPGVVEPGAVANGRRPTISDRLKALLEANAGRTLSIEAIADALGCAYNTVIQTVSVLRTVHGWTILTPVRGSYLYPGDRRDVQELGVASAPLPPVSPANVPAPTPAPLAPGRHVVMDGTGLLPGWTVVGILDQLPVLRDPRGATYRLTAL